MDAPGIPLDFTRDDTFWFEDGSVVLIAQNIGFRVYRELLTLRSEVFRDLFGMPQPQSEESQLVCGCPLIHVSDTSIAFKELLRSLLLGRRYVPKDDPELTCLSYRIRLAHKYGIEDLLEDSIWQLQELWPTSYPAWIGMPLVIECTTRAITAVNLARLTDTNFVLPSALYACSRLPDEELLGGVTHSDGTVDHLCPDDLELCKRAREHFAQSLTDFVHKTFPPSQLDVVCQDTYSCAKAYKEIREDALDAMQSAETDILAPWDDRLDNHDPSGLGVCPKATLCQSCVSQLRQTTAWFTCGVWLGLPKQLDVRLERSTRDEAWPGGCRKL